MIFNPVRFADEYELDAKADIGSGREQGSVPVVAMRLWLRAAHAVVELTGPADSNGKTFGSDGNVSLWLHESDLALGNILLNRISSENEKLRDLVREAHSCKTNEGCCEDCYCDEGCCPIERRMQELGIEAGE